jgi:hypothetical protein
MEEKLNQYAEHFGENFPIFIARRLDEDELVKIIDDCIAKNKPYEIETDENSSY